MNIIKQILLSSIRIVVILGLLGFQVMVSPVHIAKAGSTIYVDSTAEGDQDGSSWEDAFMDLQDALAIAEDGDEVWVAAGVYTPGENRALSFQIGSGVKVYGGFPVGGSEFSSRDHQLNQTILSGDIGTPINTADNSFHVVSMIGTSDTTILDGFTITDGNANGSSNYEYGVVSI